jgi:hypothetical protein
MDMRSGKNLTIFVYFATLLVSRVYAEMDMRSGKNLTICVYFATLSVSGLYAKIDMRSGKRLTPLFIATLSVSRL